MQVWRSLLRPGWPADGWQVAETVCRSGVPPAFVLNQLVFTDSRQLKGQALEA